VRQSNTNIDAPNTTSFPSRQHCSNTA